MEIVIIEINVGIKCIHVRIEYVECVGVKLGKKFLIFFIFDNTVIRAGIANSFGILQCNVWVEQEVYIQLSRFLVAAVLWNAYRVDEYICAFLRIIERKILIVLIHAQKVSCVIRSDCSRTAFHLVEDFVHDISLYKRLLLKQLVVSLLPFVKIGGVYVNSLIKLCDCKGIAGIIEHENIPGILLIPKQAPTVRRTFNHFGIINHADHAEAVGHTVFVRGIEIKIPIKRINVLVIRYI